jgi:hypothetical protein
MKPGDAFLFSYPAQKKHLMIIVCDSVSDDNDPMYHCVYVTTFRGTGFEDEACMLNPGDYPFINRPSYIVYSRLLPITKNYLNRSLEIGSATKMDPISSDLLIRIKRGAHHSKAIREIDKQYFKL